MGLEQSGSTIIHSASKDVVYILRALKKNPVLFKHKGNQVLAAAVGVEVIIKSLPGIDLVYDIYLLDTYVDGKSRHCVQLVIQSGELSVIIQVTNWLKRISSSMESNGEILLLAEDELHIE